jgi:hypothetical protein
MKESKKIQQMNDNKIPRDTKGEQKTAQENFPEPESIRYPSSTTRHAAKN